MQIPHEFDEIRPYTPEELPAVFEELIADPDFKAIVQSFYPNIPFAHLANELRQCHTNQEVQIKFFYPLLQQLAATQTLGTDMDATLLSINPEQRYTFISNHRDIVIDSAFLSMLLVQNKFPCTAEIAIGDNLLIHPWIKKLVRVNKSFIVQRSLSMRQMLESSARMSRYMHFAVNCKKENIWIAQREGRAKDSNDQTQESVLKMMAIGGEGSLVQRLKDLHLVPLSISYEYDPCDYLKAKEFQQKRDIPGFQKSRQDDLINMQQGIFGFKGHVHYHCGACIDEWLDTLPVHMPKAEFFAATAQHIDQNIYRYYRLYAGNYVAADWLEGSTRFADQYTPAEAETFKNYIENQLVKIDLPDKDETFLRHCLLKMYANPLYNHLRTIYHQKQ